MTTILADLSDLKPIVWLLPAVALYAAWRAVVYAKAKRWIILVPVVCVALLSLVEFGIQLSRAMTEDDREPAAPRGVEGDPGGTVITVPEPPPGATSNETPAGRDEGEDASP